MIVVVRRDFSRPSSWKYLMKLFRIENRGIMSLSRNILHLLIEGTLWYRLQSICNYKNHKNMRIRKLEFLKRHPSLIKIVSSSTQLVKIIHLWPAMISKYNNSTIWTSLRRIKRIIHRWILCEVRQFEKARMKQSIFRLLVLQYLRKKRHYRKKS